MNLLLTPDIEQALIEQANERGITPEQLALEGLRHLFVHSAQTGDVVQGPTLADTLAEFIGVLHSSENVPGGARLSEKKGSAFAEALLEKRRQGRL